MQVSTGFANGSQKPPVLSLPGGRRAASAGVIAWVIPGVLLIAALIFFLLFLISGAAPDLQCALALGITSAPFLIAADDAPGRLLHPLSIFGFTMLLGVAGQTIYLTHGHPAALSELLSGLSLDILNKGLMVVSVGVIALGVGYLVSNPYRGILRPGSLLTRGMELGLAKPSPRRAFWVALALCLITVIAFALYAPKVGLHSPSDLLTSRKRYTVTGGKVASYGYYRFVIGLSGIGFIFAVYTIARNRLRWRSRMGVVALALILLTAGFATVTSSRTALFVTLASAAFVEIGVRRREPRTGVVIAVVGVAIACLTLLGGLRAVETGQASSLSSRTGTEALLENAVGSRDWMDIGPTSVLVQRVPQAYPYQYGKTLASILWEPIPRTLWPGKPPVRIGPVIGPPVFGFNTVGRVSGDPPGILGELWLNGGLIAVVVGMGLLGAIIKRVERWYRLVPQTDGLSAILYGVFMVGLCLQLPILDLTGVLTSVLETLVTITVLLWIVRERGPRTT